MSHQTFTLFLPHGKHVTVSLDWSVPLCFLPGDVSVTDTGSQPQDTFLTPVIEPLGPSDDPSLSSR